MFPYTVKSSSVHQARGIPAGKARKAIRSEDWGKRQVWGALTATPKGCKIRKTRGNIMRQKPVPRRAIVLLIAGALILPIGVCVVLAVASLLVVMDDDIGGGVLRYIAIGCGILWVIDLVCLVVVQALNASADTDDPPDS